LVVKFGLDLIHSFGDLAIFILRRFGLKLPISATPVGYHTRTPFSYPSESVSSSKWHVWFASRCPDRRLSTWQMIAASCPTGLGALCGQLMFRLAWRREHSAVTATELLHPLDLACGTLFRPLGTRWFIGC